MFEENYRQEAVIKVVGVGGGGCNAVERMIENRVSDVEFITINTDSQVLRLSKADKRVLIGKKTTGGLGAGAKPEVGKKAALEQEEEIIESLSGADMVFITSGMGGGTGSGAAPVVAELAQRLNCLTLGVVTKPFSFEGKIRMANAVEAINELKQHVDTLIVIPNDRLLELTGRTTSYIEAFKKADDVLRKAVQGITEVIRQQGIINLDFSDVKTILAGSGTALMGIGMAGGETRTKDAAHLACKSSLLETSITGATKGIVYITSNFNLSLEEINEVLDEIKTCTCTDIDLIWGTAINTTLNDEIIVTVIATGFTNDPLLQAQDKPSDELELEDDNPRARKLKEKKEKKEKKGKNVNKKLPSWLD